MNYGISTRGGGRRIMLSLGGVLVAALTLNHLPTEALAQATAQRQTTQTPVRRTPPTTRAVSARTPSRLAFAQAASARTAASRPLSQPRRNGTTAPKATLEEAQRALKLGSTYREARNYDLAQKYIQRGIELAQKAQNPYWEATGYEYLGLVYRDIGDRTAAMAALQRAADMFNGIIKQPNGSQNSTQALMDDVRRNERSRPPATMTTPSTPSGTDLDRERLLNKQLSERVIALESKIRALEDRTIVTPGAARGAFSAAPSLPPAIPSESSPGVIARTMPRQVPDGGKPQAEFAPFQTEKKPVPAAIQPQRPAPARAVVMDVVTLPIFTLQIGIGAGYNLNTKSMISSITTTTPPITYLSGNAPLISFPLLSLSGDYFLTPNFSIGLMYGYYPGPDQSTSASITTGSPASTNNVASQTTTSYHLVTLRPAVHLVRDRTMDIYAGLSFGTMLNFTPLRLYAGLMAGFQYNFTRQVGAFIELSGGGTYVGDTPLQKATDFQASGTPLLQIGAFGRVGLAVNF